MDSNQADHRAPQQLWPLPHRGMPPFDTSGPPVSFFEFWPPRYFYAPMFLYWAWLTLRHGSPSLPTISNPLFPMGGWAGESKLEVMKLLGPLARDVFAPWMAAGPLKAGDNAHVLAQTTVEAAQRSGLTLPMVAKPDMGLRGAGVRRIRSAAELAAYMIRFPRNERFVLQQLVDEEGEAGVFYIRKPSQERGRIFSLTLKYFPYVYGDGQSTLEQLIMRDSRAGKLSRLYLPRHKERLGAVLAPGEPFRLAFAGSHSRGAIFRDGGQFVTAAMTEAFDRIAKDIREFYFGRFDIRFANFADVQAGHGFKIVEVNGAGAEATHIWDRKMTLRGAYGVLMEQYRLMWEIGAENRARGYEPTTLIDFLVATEREAQLVTGYPMTE